MAYGYGWVPYVPQEDFPPDFADYAAFIIEHGVQCAHNEDYTDMFAILVTEDIPTKICGYYIDEYFYVVLANHNDTSVVTRWARRNGSTSAFDTYTQHPTYDLCYHYRQAASPYGPLPYASIPTFGNLDECLQAMNDGIWEKNEDPYAPGGYTGTGGGSGTFSGTGDAISIPSLPTLSAVQAGFITLFNPSVADLHALATYMWDNPLFDVNNWKKIFADPMEAILGLSIVPVNIPTSGSGVVTVGNISTGISMAKASTQYVAVDCGTLNVEEYWGSYLDYDPYTKAEIYLPYCGTHPLATDDIMGKSVHVVYHIDILSGACTAFVKCGNSVLYTFIGQCTCSIPITGKDWTNVVNGALNIATSIGSMVATGGLTAPMAVADIAATTANTIKPNVEKSGAMGGMGGMLGVQTPYLILTRPRQALPNRQNRFSGYPSFITRQLSTVGGYTEIDSIQLSDIPATDDEVIEIENLLKEGVIL